MPEKNAEIQQGGAKGGAQFCQDDDGLRVVIDAWPRLPTQLQEAILALISAAEQTTSMRESARGKAQMRQQQSHCLNSRVSS